MTNHLGRGPRIVLVVLAVVLGACPTARAQQDVDRVVSEAIDKWNEGSPVSREEALQRLGSLGRDARAAIPQLIGALRDPNPRIRVRVAAFIEHVGTAPKESVPALTALLKDPDAAVRDAAASALATLGRRAEGSIDAMVESLHSPADRRCLRAAFTLAMIGEAALPALIDLLKADDPASRRAAIQGIGDVARSGRWRPGSALARATEPHYPTLARDPDPGVRFALASMLIDTRSDSPHALSALGRLLRDPDSDVPLAIAGSVGTYAYLPTGLRASFLGLVKGGDLDVRLAATGAIPREDLAAAVVIDRLLATLKDPDPHVRTAVAEKLAGARYTFRQTDNQRRPVATVICTSLALAHHPAAGRILVSALDDSCPGVRAAAAHLLPAFPAEAATAIPRLTDRLGDQAPAVRASAAGALAEFGPASSGAVRLLLGILANPDDGSEQGRLVTFNAARSLAAVGGDARAKMLRLLTGQLNSLDDQVKRRAEQIVVGLGPGVVGDLLRILSDPKSPRLIQLEAQGLLYTLHVQNEARHVLAARPARPEVLAARPVLRSLSRDAEPEVQLAAVALLAAINPGDVEVAELYLDYLRSGKNPDLVDQWLGYVVGPAMIPTLVKGLRDPDSSVRFATASVLSALAARLFGDEVPGPEGQGLKVQAARALLSCLKDRDVRVRWVAAETLGVLHVEAEAVLPALIAMVKNEGGGVPTNGIPFHAFQEDQVLGRNNQGDDPLRIAAIRALGGFGREAAGAVPQLVRALGDDDPRVRWFAIEALALIGPAAKAAVPALVEALRSHDLAYALASEDSDALKDGPIRLIAAFALGRIGPEARAAIPDLIAALSGPDSRVRGEAARALGLIGPEARAAVPALIRLVTRGTVAEVAERAAEALGRLGSVAVPAVIEMLHDADPEVRETALGILGQMDARAAVPVSEPVRCLRDRDADVRKAAAAALGQTGDRRVAVAAILPLLIALRDREGEVSDAARDALARIGRPVLPAVLSRWNAMTAHAIEPVEEFESVVIPLDAPGR